MKRPAAGPGASGCGRGRAGPSPRFARSPPIRPPPPNSAPVRGGTPPSPEAVRVGWGGQLLPTEPVGRLRPATGRGGRGGSIACKGWRPGFLLASYSRPVRLAPPPSAPPPRPARGGPANTGAPALSAAETSRSTFEASSAAWREARAPNRGQGKRFRTQEPVPRDAPGGLIPSECPRAPSAGAIGAWSGEVAVARPGQLEEGV